MNATDLLEKSMLRDDLPEFHPGGDAPGNL